MKTELLAALEQRIDAWIQEYAEKEELPTDCYYPENLHVMMAKAAAIVFDANQKGQVFAEEQKGE